MSNPINIHKRNAMGLGIGTGMKKGGMVEKSETPAQEKAESKKTQDRERKLGIEKKKGGKVTKGKK